MTMTRFTTLQKLISGCTLLMAAAVAHPQDFVVGGSLQVARDGPVGATLLSNTTSFRAFFVDLMYDTVANVAVVSNRQDQFGIVSVFNTSTPVGTTVQLRPNPINNVINGQTVNFFPEATPLMLFMTAMTTPGDFPDGRFSTASIGKELPRGPDPVARVAYGSDDTAIVSFPSGGGGFNFSVRLMNVLGAGGRC
jgi:hypothetical protein